MSSGLVSVPADKPLYRVGRQSDAWAWPDWAYAGADHTFGQRWDDPCGEYRVLYACSQRAGAFVETLAPFRADLSLVAELAEIDGPDLDRAPGVVPWTWLSHRSCGEAVVSGRFSDVGAASSLALLRQALASDAIQHGLPEIDGAAIRSSAPRGFTQRLSRFVHDWKDPDGQFDGIRYVSRWGNEFVNWALFEPTEGKTSSVQSTRSDAIQADDVGLQAALRILNLTFG